MNGRGIYYGSFTSQSGVCHEDACQLAVAAFGDAIYRGVQGWFGCFALTVVPALHLESVLYICNSCNSGSTYGIMPPRVTGYPLPKWQPVTKLKGGKATIHLHHLSLISGTGTVLALNRLLFRKL